MKLLLISFSFPPAGGVGVLRALSLAKYLPQSGIQVDVLTARNAPHVGKDLSLLAQVPDAVTIHRTWTPDLPFALRKQVKRLTLGKGKGGKGTDQRFPIGTAPKGNLLRRVLGNLLLPDPQVGWLPFAFRAARRIIRDRKIDVVVITVPPFSTAGLASRLRREFPALPILVDFRDEWLTTTINLVSFNNNDRARAIAAAAEAEAVRASTAVVLVTEAAQRELVKRYPDQPAAKFHCIPNGFESRETSSDPGRTHSKDGRLRLTYAGSVYGSTDPTSFVQAVLKLPPELRSRLRIRFIGHVESAAARRTLESLGDTVELVGFIPQAEALKALHDSDYLLLISHDPINVSAKFYDYLSSDRPILGLLHPESDARKLLRETGAGVWADVRDPESISKLLTMILAGDFNGELTKRDQSLIGTYHRRALTLRYAHLLEQVVNPK